MRYPIITTIFSLQEIKCILSHRMRKESTQLLGHERLQRRRPRLIIGPCHNQSMTTHPTPLLILLPRLSRQVQILSHPIHIYSRHPLLTVTLPIFEQQSQIYQQFLRPVATIRRNLSLPLCPSSPTTVTPHLYPSPQTIFKLLQKRTKVSLMLLNRK